MGFISNLVNSKGEKPSSKSTWREFFGDTDKERNTTKPDKPVVPGGSYGRSLATHDNAFKRLLEAMRSQAPGGWSDDRWEQSKHFNSIAYVAINRQNELLSESEFQVWEKDESSPEGKIPGKSPGAKKLIRLLERPNGEDGFGDLCMNWNLQLSLTGMALTWIVPNALGEPFELYPIPTATAIPQPVVNPEYPHGYYRIQPVYPYGPFSSYPTPNTAIGAAIPAEWMMKFKHPHPLLRYEGYSPLTALRLHIDEVESMDRSRWYSMKRSINPSAVLNFGDMESMQPLSEPEIERIKAEFEMEQQGAENAGRLFVSTPGANLEPWGNTPKDMDYQAGWDQLVSFVMGGLGITKPAAGMVEDSSYATLFASLKQLYWLTLEPRVNRIAAKLTRHLASHFGDNLIVEVRCKRIDDHEVKFGKLDKALQGKCITKNEMRKELDFPPTKEEWGEEIAGSEAQQDQQQGMDQQGNPFAGLMGGNEEQEIQNEQPDPGTLNEGSLGSRMGTVKALRKLYHRNGVVKC